MGPSIPLVYGSGLGLASEVRARTGLGQGLMGPWRTLLVGLDTTSGSRDSGGRVGSDPPPPPPDGNGPGGAGLTGRGTPPASSRRLGKQKKKDARIKDEKQLLPSQATTTRGGVNTLTTARTPASPQSPPGWWSNGYISKGKTLSLIRRTISFPINFLPTINGGPTFCNLYRMLLTLTLIGGVESLPPFFCITYQPSFSHLSWKFVPRSSQVRSPGQVKGPYLLKSLWCYSSYSFWEMNMKLSGYH